MCSVLFSVYTQQLWAWAAYLDRMGCIYCIQSQEPDIVVDVFYVRQYHWFKHALPRLGLRSLFVRQGRPYCRHTPTCDCGTDH